MSEALDPRFHAFRPDLADVRLEGQVAADRFAEGTLRRVVVNAAPLRDVPAPDSPLATELIRGETVRVFDESAEGWAWLQSTVDDYVGYVPSDAIGNAAPEPTHAVRSLRTFVYPGPDMKFPALTWLSFLSRVAVTGEEVETRGTRFRLLAGGEGAVVASHVAAIASPREKDFVAVAERFVETPYLWGGRTSLGLDCSALVELALMAVGGPAVRDSDRQEASLGVPVEGGVGAALGRGDLVFWNRHVGVMVDATRMVHASGHHMKVVVEPLVEAVARIARAGSHPTSVKRL